MTAMANQTTMAAAALVVVTLIPPVAAAYTRSETEDGEELWWKETRLTYYIDSGGCADMDDGSDFEAIRAAFGAWDAVTCAYGPFRMDIVFGGPVEGKRIGFDPRPGAANENLLAFQDDPHEWTSKYGSTAAIAMTSVTYDVHTGQIYDADIEYNDAYFRFTTINIPVRVPDDTQDLQNTTAHEVGHMLGLGHSDDPNATMYGQARPGETKKRTLSDDDLEGVCTVVPPDWDKEVGATGDDYACAVSPSRPLPWGWIVAATLGLGVLVRR